VSTRRTVKAESYREGLLESLRNPDEAALYLNACLEDEDFRVFLLALRDVADTTAEESGPFLARWS
jgi:DNA-binding phage protein